ncbi:MAG: DUF1326 domain-containing protein [Xanthobacteraceae bacterium]
MSDNTNWWAKGLLFENYSCQVVCHGHFHFTQDCTHERCVGYWGIDVADGDFAGTSLAGVRAVIMFDAPQRMADGGWMQMLYVDRSASADQVTAMEKIISGEAGGPWKILARFVADRRPTRQDNIIFTSEPKSRSATVGSVLRGLIKPLKGRDRDKPVTIENVYNQIHAPSQELGMGTTSYDDGSFRVETSETHALQSHFSWAGSF